MTTEAPLVDAAERVVAAFGAHDVPAYFACFAQDASFLFYSSPELLPSRAAFEREWERWEADDGYRVLSCVASDRRAQLLTEEVGIVTHSLETRVSSRSGEETLRERETLVLRRDQQRGWLIVHEHLSPLA